MGDPSTTGITWGNLLVVLSVVGMGISITRPLFRMMKDMERLKFRVSIMWSVFKREHHVSDADTKQGGEDDA